MNHPHQDTLINEIVEIEEAGELRKKRNINKKYDCCRVK
jgi:hypothetical protein